MSYSLCTARQPGYDAPIGHCAPVGYPGSNAASVFSGFKSSNSFLQPTVRSITQPVVVSGHSTSSEKSMSGVQPKESGYSTPSKIPLSTGHSRPSGQSTPVGILFKDPLLLEELDQYLPKPIHMWREEDCQSWMKFVCDQNGIDHKVVEDCASIQMTGLDLLKWTLSDFSLLFGPANGFKIYEELCRKERALVAGIDRIALQRSVGVDGNGPTKVQKLRAWEFLAVHLANPHYNPSSIMWENEAEGFFKLAVPLEIIKSWSKCVYIPQTASVNNGYDANNSGLKSKLSRAVFMAYRHFLEHLSQDIGTLHLYKIDGKQLRYKLGNEAMELYRRLTET